MPNAFVHTPAVAGLNSQCIDGGFSFPHRTLGANMLKDEIYGIDYDGTPVAAGDDRTAGAGIDLAAYGNIGGQTWYNSWVSENTTDTSLGYGKWVESGTQLSTSTAIAAENLDSVCLDCHGDATYWNGDDTTYWTPGKGWEVLVKGLP
jgi:hypothetical protein